MTQEGLSHVVSSLVGCVLKLLQRCRYSVFALFRVNEEAEDVNRSYSRAVELRVASAAKQCSS